MFKNNKYTNWYFSIINRAKCRKINSYFEKHHIIPKCIGGSDDKENIIELTAREHFICHLLLTKMHDSNKLKYALVILMVKNEHQSQRYVPNSRIYESIKTINSKLASEKFTGKQKHNTGKKRAYCPITFQVKMFSDDEIPEGWIRGNSPQMRKNQKGKNKGKVYYNNPMTGEVIALNQNEDPPIDFIKGNPKAATAPSKDKILCYDPITLKSKRVKEIPEGWIEGSPFVWITNGKDSKQILKNDILPEGYYYGRSEWRKC